MDPLHAKTEGGRTLLRRTAKGLFLLAAGLLALLALACAFRAPCASWALRSALARAGLPDVSFRLARLSPSCVVVEDVRLGDPVSPLLAVERAEVRYSLADALGGHIDRVRISGVETPFVWRSSGVCSPLLERLATVVSNAAAGSRGVAVARPRTPAGLPVGEVSLYDVRVPLRAADGRELDRLCVDVVAVAEPDTLGGKDRSAGRLRVLANAKDSLGLEARLAGALTPQSGSWSASAEAKVRRVDDWVAPLRAAAPEWLARLPVLPTNCSAAVRGTASGSGWTRVGPFEGTFELGRNSGVVWGSKGEYVRLQTFRVEASGTPADVQCRLSAGVSGFRVEGGGLQAAQEEGRLLGLRGSARLQQTATNRTLRATCDTDLPGRTAMQVLAHVLPFFSKLLTDGGTLHVEADLAQASPKEAWQGEVRYSAEVRRSAATTPRGRVGAGRVALDGAVRVADSRPGPMRTTVRVEDAYFFRTGLSVKGGALMALDALPPYRSAKGTFEGQVTESASLAQSGVEIPEAGVRFGGRAAVDGLASNPVWRVDVEVPEAEVGTHSGGVACRAKLGASARVTYGATQFSLACDAWARDASAALSVTGAAQRTEAGFARAAAHAEIGETDPARLSNAVWRVGLSLRDGWFRAGGAVALEGAEAEVPLRFSQAQGLDVDGGARLTWRRLESQGLRFVPGAWALRSAGGALDASLGVSVEGCRFAATASARLPLADPGQLSLELAVPEAEWGADDAVGALLRRLDSSSTVTGRAAAEAHVRFLGGHPIVTGEARLAGVQVSRGSVKILGLGAAVPFELGVGMRTTGRPFVSFDSAQVGNVRLGAGRLEFQVTPEELFLDRMEVLWCKGQLHAYSVHLDPRRPKVGVDVYADRIDLGEALAMVMPFRGKMEGVLYGRFPVGIDGGHVHLSTGFLYSLPGQGGKLRLDGHEPMQSLLERAGVIGEVQVPLSKALSDMDFDAIRLELSPKTDGDAVLRVKLDGKSNFREWPAPVDLELNLHGPLEKLVNVGLDLSRKQ